MQSILNDFLQERSGLGRKTTKESTISKVLANLAENKDSNGKEGYVNTYRDQLEALSLPLEEGNNQEASKTPKRVKTHHDSRSRCNSGSERQSISSTRDLSFTSTRANKRPRADSRSKEVITDSR
jgi:hypothetical protein